MGRISIIKPEQTVNIIRNPSAKGAANYAALGAATVTINDAFGAFGYTSYNVATTAAAGDGLNLTTDTASNAIHYVTFAIAGTTPSAANLQVSMDLGVNWNAVTLIKDNGDWSWYYVQIPAAQANGSTSARIRQADAVARTFHIDAVQGEAKDDHYTTYCDGSQDGCEWLGAKHGSSSRRSAQYRGGGRVYDLDSDWNMRVDTLGGLGMPPVQHNVREYAMQPGALLQNVKVQPRVITLACHTVTRSESALYTARSNTIDALKNDLVVTNQPVRLRYTGATSWVECDAYYDSGLDGLFEKTFHEALAIRLIACDPFWYGYGTDTVRLDSADSTTVSYVAGRINGLWNVLGPPAGGVTTAVYVVDDDPTYVYFGGDFTNWNGTGADYIVRYEKATGTWSAMAASLAGTATPQVKALYAHPNGNLYIGGAFTNAGGDPFADYFCVWDGTSFSSVGKPAVGATIVDIRDIAVDSVGDIYIVGYFSNLAGVADADGIARWDISASTWNAVGAPSTGAALTSIDTIDIDPNDNIYVGGVFLNLAGVAAADYIAKYDGSNWVAMDTGFNSYVDDVKVAPDGSIYAAGAFTASGDAVTTLNRVAQWTGATWIPLGDGLDAEAYSLDIALDGTLYAGGAFTQAGGITLADRVARWNGYTWAHMDLDFPGAPKIYDILVTNPDPVVRENYDLYLSFDTAGATTIAGAVTATNTGSAIAYPIIVFSQSGGTTGPVTLKTIRNEVTGKELLFDLDILDGEEITIDLRPGQKTITSTWRGNVIGDLLPNSDMASFYLLPGDNLVTCFASVTAPDSPTVDSYLLWQITYWSIDGAE